MQQPNTQLLNLQPAVQIRFVAALYYKVIYKACILFYLFKLLPMPAYHTFKEAVAAMRDRGFTHTFSIQKQQVFCSELGTAIEPERLTLLEKHHVKIDGSDDEERDIYGFVTEENTYGLMTSTYAAYDPEGFESIFRRCRKGQTQHG
ncbi:hypothetical protein [uncultured Pontibacter sp.]|uniref:hypothetical protein n=1 Tax=uncultured Pontibacter sp. TaxID=453356 RepID=UPI0026292BA3|nr:hypothetical protein [uncultured Pontibacter sp.]